MGKTLDLGLRVDDADRNTDANARDTVEARVLTRPGGVARVVQLTETGANTGVFRGSVATALGSSGTAAQALALIGGEVIQATFRDTIIDTGETDVEAIAVCRVRRVGLAPFTASQVVLDGIADQWPLENVLKAPHICFLGSLS